MPVILIPGLAGSELYNKNELVWLNSWRLVGSHLPIFDLFNMGWLMPLRLAKDGVAPYNSSHEIRVGDVMRHHATDAYSGMVKALKGRGYSEGHDLRLFPYDWRKDPTQAADQLGRLVDRTLAETGAPQVILIGHSQGGLIARDYVVRGGAPKVKATISLATPWLGAPMAYRAVEYGWDLGLKLPGTKWSALGPKDVKLLVKNYPSVYALAPGPAYFEWYGAYLIRGGKALNHAQTLDQAMAPHNRALALQGAAYQKRLLNGNDHGVMQFLMAGSGRSTLVRLTERTDWLGAKHKVEHSADGDEVVPLHSADLGFRKDPARAERSIGKITDVVYVKAPHTLFAQAPVVHETVLGWLEIIHGRRPARCPGPC